MALAHDNRGGRAGPSWGGRWTTGLAGYRRRMRATQGSELARQIEANRDRWMPASVDWATT